MLNWFQICFTCCVSYYLIYFCICWREVLVILYFLNKNPFWTIDWCLRFYHSHFSNNIFMKNWKKTIINYSALGKRNNSWHTLNKIHTWSDLQLQKWIDPANHNIIGEVGKSCWFVWWISHICGCRHLAACSTLSLGPMSFKKTYRLLNCTLSCSPRQVIQFLFKYRHQTVKSIILNDFFFYQILCQHILYCENITN